EERLRAVFVREDRDGLAREERRGVALLAEGLAVAPPVEDAFALVRRVIDPTGEEPVETAEAARVRPLRGLGVPEVPLADHGRRVARARERRGEELLVEREAAAVGGQDVPAQSEAQGRTPRQETRACGRAQRRRAVALEPQAFPRQRVDRRRQARF